MRPGSLGVRLPAPLHPEAAAPGGAQGRDDRNLGEEAHVLDRRRPGVHDRLHKRLGIW